MESNLYFVNWSLYRKTVRNPSVNVNVRGRLYMWGSVFFSLCKSASDVYIYIYIYIYIGERGVEGVKRIGGEPFDDS